MPRGDSADVEFEVAHMAMKFIRAKGLLDEFYSTYGKHCDEGCMHEEWPVAARWKKVTEDDRPEHRPIRS